MLESKRYPFLSIFVSLLAATWGPQVVAESEDGRLVVGVMSESEFKLYRDIDRETDILPYFIYRKGRFYVDELDLGYDLIDYGDLRIATHLHTNTEGYEPSESDYFIGMEERDIAWEGGIAVFAEFDEWEICIQMLTDVSDTHGGGFVSVNAAHEVDLNSAWTFEPSLTLISHDSRFNRYYYGVSINDSAPGRPFYAPGNSQDAMVAFEFEYHSRSNWTLSLELERIYYDGTVSDSPLVQNGEATSLELLIGYSFN